MKVSLVEIYKQRISEFTLQQKKVQHQINLIALLRVAEFLLGIWAVYHLTTLGQGLWAWLVFAFFAIVFLFLVKIHSDLKQKKEHLIRLGLINQQEIKALQGNFEDFDTGKEWIPESHPFLFDLDILGERSIFQWLNRTTSVVGNQLLANWLIYPCKNAEQIIERQQAIRELAPKLAFRQHFRANGMKLSETLSEKEAILEWFAEPPVLIQKKIYPFLLVFFPTIALTVVLFASLGWYATTWAFIPLTVNLLIVGIHARKLSNESAQVSRRSKFLKKYAQLLAIIESESFESDYLKTIQDKLVRPPRKASESLSKLYQIIYHLENGASFTGLIFNGLFLWSLQYLYRLEKWQAELQVDFYHWFEAVAEIDALNSLANMHYNEPTFVFPSIHSQSFVLQAEMLAHPLLDEQVRVSNPVFFEQLGQLVLITGANMAGKSTYLRAVGVNLVLAMSGAPVCATHFSFQPIDIFTSMRTKDSLQANESFFYAELKRLKELIDKLEKGENVFIMLDEILKGTNSVDQHAGSSALINQLIRLKGVGLIATHDLSLGQLEKKYPHNIQNQCFEIEIKEDELFFDYKLRKGINQNLNATFLMKKMGITI